MSQDDERAGETLQLDLRQHAFKAILVAVEIINRDIESGIGTVSDPFASTAAREAILARLLPAVELPRPIAFDLEVLERARVDIQPVLNAVMNAALDAINARR